LTNNFQVSRATSSSIARRLSRLTDGAGLGCLAEQFIKLPSADGCDQGVDHGRDLIFGRDDDAGLTLLELAEDIG
jgi:hypothetical protein